MVADPLCLTLRRTADLESAERPSLDQRDSRARPGQRLNVHRLRRRRPGSPCQLFQPGGRTCAPDKTFRAFDPHQVLLPPSLDDWLPEDHLARLVADLVDEVLDLGPILADYSEKRGYRPTTLG